MKLLVVAHTPPPLHGQSKMVELFIQSLDKADSKITPIHLNLKFVKNIEDISKFQLRKVILLIYYCLKLTWLLIRHNPYAVYYIPAPAKRITIYRDLLILLFLKLFKSRIIFHWHAVGLGGWFINRENHGFLNRFENSLLNLFYRNADLSIVLSNSSRADAETFYPKQTVVIHNGIPDPCSEFHQTVLPHREEKLAGRIAILRGEEIIDSALIFNFIFLSQCSREKGLFDALSGLKLLAENICLKHPKIKINFQIAGIFPSKEEERSFREISEKQNEVEVTFCGFVKGEAKRLLLAEGDCLLFPTYYANEGFPVAVIEALAFGLPVLTTNWRGIPEIIGVDYDFLIPIHEPKLIAEKAYDILHYPHFAQLRKRYEENFTYKKFTLDMRKAILGMKVDSTN